MPALMGSAAAAGGISAQLSCCADRAGAWHRLVEQPCSACARLSWVWGGSCSVFPQCPTPGCLDLVRMGMVLEGGVDPMVWDVLWSHLAFGRAGWVKLVGERALAV